MLAQATFKRNSILGTFRAAAELMSKAPGQRVMFLFSDGFSLLDTRGNVESLDLQQAISRAVRSAVVVYSINSKGLEAPLEIDASRRWRFDEGLRPHFPRPALELRVASEKEAQTG